MSLVSKGYFLTVTVVDNGLNSSTLTYDLTAADAATAATDAIAIMAALNGVTDGAYKAYSVGERFVQDALTVPASGVHVEDLAVVSAKITGTVDKYATIKIPAPAPGIFVGTEGSAANTIDAADSAVVAYLGLFTAGGEATVSDGETIQAVTAANVKGKRVHRASRRG